MGYHRSLFNWGQQQPSTNINHQPTLRISFWSPKKLCEDPPRMGVDADPRAEPKLDCPENELLKFSGPLGRVIGCCSGWIHWGSYGYVKIGCGFRYSGPEGEWICILQHKSTWRHLNPPIAGFRVIFTFEVHLSTVGDDPPEATSPLILGISWVEDPLLSDGTMPESTHFLWILSGHGILLRSLPASLGRRVRQRHPRRYLQVDGLLRRHHRSWMQMLAGSESRHGLFVTSRPQVTSWFYKPLKLHPFTIVI